MQSIAVDNMDECRSYFYRQRCLQLLRIGLECEETCVTINNNGCAATAALMFADTACRGSPYLMLSFLH